MLYKKASFVFVLIMLMITALLFRIAYISFGGLNDKVRPVAGGRSAQISLYSSKGVIYDCNLNALSGNQPCLYLVINPREFDKNKTEEILKVTNISESDFTEKLLTETPFILIANSSFGNIKGVTVFEGYKRYNDNSIAQHILGYLDSEGIVGLSGVERAYNNEISRSIIETSLEYSSNAVRGAMDEITLNKQDVKQAFDYGVVLTLDKTLSETAERIFKTQISNGALVIMDAHNGDILTICSNPSFDVDKITEYISAQSSELLNNSLCNQPVGSVFKMIIAACACLNGMDDFCFECSGGIEIGGKAFNCQNNTCHGNQTLEDAFSNSCNSYFIALGQLLGYDKIVETAQLFGVDSSIELCKEIYSYSGKLPSDNGIFALANLSIGQGELELSPLCIARITATLANGGYLVNPNLYKSMYFDNEVIKTNGYKYRTKILSDEIAEKLKKMCIQCVEIGTGKSANPNFAGAGGKTASAQTGKFKADQSEILATYFTGFFPAQSPRYIITVFANDGKSGSATCAPVFKEICDFIYQNY